MDDTRDPCSSSGLGFRLDDGLDAGKKLLRDNGAISRGDPQLFHELRNCEEEERRRGRGKARSARINEKLDAK